jgi:hypothetical protein
MWTSSLGDRDVEDGWQAPRERRDCAQGPAKWIANTPTVKTAASLLDRSMGCSITAMKETRTETCNDRPTSSRDSILLNARAMNDRMGLSQTWEQGPTKEMRSRGQKEASRTTTIVGRSISTRRRTRARHLAPRSRAACQEGRHKLVTSNA